MRCLAMVEAVNHPDRILHPLRRVGERGENMWEEITMDEAYAIIAEKAREVTEEYGPKSIVTGIGTGRNATWRRPRSHSPDSRPPTIRRACFRETAAIRRACRP